MLAQTIIRRINAITTKQVRGFEFVFGQSKGFKIINNRNTAIQHFIQIHLVLGLLPRIVREEQIKIFHYNAVADDRAFLGSGVGKVQAGNYTDVTFP